MIEEIQIFRPKGYRPPRDERWEMKQSVLARDGLTDCFWCRKPFASIDDATLEHILPLADGGRHDLRNCTLACDGCNNRNAPRIVISERINVAAQKKLKAAVNVALNGGVPDECDKEVASRFPAILRDRHGKVMKYADASFLLKNIHRQLGRQPPSATEKHIFKASFNRYQSVSLIRLAEK